MHKAIKLQKVSFAYPGKKPVLNDINVEIDLGDFVGITGTNGSGKTTFSYLLNGLVPHLIEGTLHGEIVINGVSTKRSNVSVLSKSVGFLFQNPDYSLFNLTVKEEILFGISNFQLSNPEARVKKNLELVGMSDYEEYDPKTLSFGQKQKINLAAILSLETPILVLDEPTAMLDFKSSVELYTLLRTLNKKGTTIIVIEHDTDFLLHFAKTIVILDKGTVASTGVTKTIFKNTNLLKSLGIKIPHKINL